MGPLQLLNCCYLFSIVVRICVSFSICRKCLYDTNVTKYLVLVKDDVEAGDERLKEFEQELQDMGLFDTQFSLGDLLDEEEAETNTDQPPETKKKKLEEFPPIEGEESLMEYIGQFKKACLTRKANLKTAKERLEKDKASGHETLASNCLLTNQQLKYVDTHTQKKNLAGHRPHSVLCKDRFPIFAGKCWFPAANKFTKSIHGGPHVPSFGCLIAVAQ